MLGIWDFIDSVNGYKLTLTLPLTNTKIYKENAKIYL